jgi:1-deoxy-D-xylulose-5-phosphate synthase
MAQEFPRRLVDVGIAEPHALTFAAGLAAAGQRPVVAIYSTFLQRALDGIIHDVALQNLPVVLGVDRAGLVGQDGATHQGAYDLVYLSMIPNLTVHAPATLQQLDECLDQALQAPGPVAIRYARGPGPETLTGVSSITLSKLVQPADPELIVVALGSTVINAQAAVQSMGASAARVALWSTALAKPVAPDLLAALAKHPGIPVVTLEEGVTPGGFGSRLRAQLDTRPFHEWGFPDRFIEHATPAEQEAEVGLSAEALGKRLGALLR